MNASLEARPYLSIVFTISCGDALSGKILTYRLSSNSKNFSMFFKAKLIPCFFSRVYEAHML